MCNEQICWCYCDNDWLVFSGQDRSQWYSVVSYLFRALFDDEWGLRQWKNAETASTLSGTVVNTHRAVGSILCAIAS